MIEFALLIIGLIACLAIYLAAELSLKVAALEKRLTKAHASCSTQTAGVPGAPLSKHTHTIHLHI